MYRDHSTIYNTELIPWIQRLSAFTAEDIKKILDRPALAVPAEARAILEKHPWATAARAICRRAPADDPEKWRLALPPDRKPIVLIFGPENSDAEGYTPDAAPAADYDHFPRYKYIGVDEEGHHQFVNSVLRQKKDNRKEWGVGYELVVLSGQDTFVSLYLGNDGNNPELPKEFREVRLNKELATAYGQVIDGLEVAIASTPDEECQRIPGLEAHLGNYKQHLRELNAG